MGHDAVGQGRRVRRPGDRASRAARPGRSPARSRPRNARVRDSPVRPRARTGSSWSETSQEDPDPPGGLPADRRTATVEEVRRYYLRRTCCARGKRRRARRVRRGTAPPGVRGGLGEQRCPHEELVGDLPGWNPCRTEPLYDQVFTAQWPAFSVQMALKLGGTKEFAAVTLARFRELARRVGESPDVAEAIVTETVVRAAIAWAALREHPSITAAYRNALRRHWQKVPLLQPHTSLLDSDPVRDG